MTCKECSERISSYFCTICGVRYCDKHLTAHPHGTDGLTKYKLKQFRKSHPVKLEVKA